MAKKQRPYGKAKSSLLQAKKSCIATKKMKSKGFREVTKVNPPAEKANANIAKHCPNCGYPKLSNKGFYPGIFKHSKGHRNEEREPGIYPGIYPGAYPGIYPTGAYGAGCGVGCGPFAGELCPGSESFLGNLCHLLGDCIQVNTEDGRCIVGTLADIGYGFITIACGSTIAYVRIEDITAIIPVD